MSLPKETTKKVPFCTFFCLLFVGSKRGTEARQRSKDGVSPEKTLFSHVCPFLNRRESFNRGAQRISRTYNHNCLRRKAPTSLTVDYTFESGHERAAAFTNRAREISQSVYADVARKLDEHGMDTCCTPTGQKLS